MSIIINLKDKYNPPNELFFGLKTCKFKTSLSGPLFPQKETV